MGINSEKCFRIRVLRDVARRPSVQAGASDPSYSGGLAACAVVPYLDLLQPWVADPGRGAERLSERLFYRDVHGFVA